MRIPIPVRLPRDVVDWVDRQATAADEPRSVILRRILRDAMERDRKQSRCSKAQAHSAMESAS